MSENFGSQPPLCTDFAHGLHLFRTRQAPVYAHGLAPSPRGGHGPLCRHARLWMTPKGWNRAPSTMRAMWGG